MLYYYQVFKVFFMLIYNNIKAYKYKNNLGYYHRSAIVMFIQFPDDKIYSESDCI